MKPAPFEYAAPRTVEEALAVLFEHPDEARVLAGGQSLVPLMNFRMARPGWLVDINHLDELAFIREEGSHLLIGALTREHAIERSAEVVRRCPVLAEASRWIGHPAIRHRGTIGGSLAHNDPSAEYPLIAALLDVEVVVRGPDAGRTIPFRDFSVSLFTTALEAAEMVVAVRVPTLDPGVGWSFREVARRHGDFAIVSVGATLTMDGGAVSEARLALGGVGSTPIRAAAAEMLLRGQTINEELIQAAAESVAATVEPPSDLHGSAEYRRDLSRALVKACLREARGRANG